MGRYRWRQDVLRQPQSIHDSSQRGIPAVSVHGTQDSLYSRRNHLGRGGDSAAIEDDALVQAMIPADLSKIVVIKGSANSIPAPLSNPCQYDSLHRRPKGFSAVTDRSRAGCRARGCTDAS